jgi:spore germination protein GerM
LIRLAGLGFLLLAWWSWRHHSVFQSRQDKAGLPVQASLYSGKESKRRVLLVFASERGSAEMEEREIYRTASLVNQAKQVVLDLLEGPHGRGLVRTWPQGSGMRELFLDPKGRCVLDLSPETLQVQPGGTTAEYLSLYSLVKSLTGTFPEIQSVQILIGGERRETLAGHIDISGPLTKESF